VIRFWRRQPRPRYALTFGNWYGPQMRLELAAKLSIWDVFQYLAIGTLRHPRVIWVEIETL
jgi:hypothetical protein